MRRCLTLLVVVLLVSACGDETQSTKAAAPSPTAAPTSEPMPEPVLMPDLVGLFERQVDRRIGEIYVEGEREISQDRRGEVVLDCSVVPDMVIRQAPAPGTPLVRKRIQVKLWAAYLDLERFRGPCDPEDGELGPVRGADARLAREFYRFAADPTLGAPFVDGDVWFGIEGGPVHTWVSAADRTDPEAWEVDSSYAERIGPFSALDVLAMTGGRYEVHRGVVPTCNFPSEPEVPTELSGLRAISLTSAEDSIGSCSQWFGVTLFVDGPDRIAGVALRLGSP